MIVGEDYAHSEAEAGLFIAEFDNTYSNSPDLGTRIAQLCRLNGLPETYFVNANGDLPGVINGPITETELQQWSGARLHA